MTTDEALDAIRSLCDAEDERWRGRVGSMGTRIPVAAVREVLAAADWPAV